MKQTLTKGQYLTIASMLFGLFFGAGNLIFPVSMGQMSGHNIWFAIAGFLITGVGLPLLGVIALGISRCNGLFQMSSRVSAGYGTFFTCMLYLTIGPFFAIPRCATVPYSIGVEPLLRQGSASSLPLLLFSFIFFMVVLWFSLRPNGILTWVGKILNPIFLVFLSMLLITAFVKPMGRIRDIVPTSSYNSSPFLNGFLEGYNTMDALAGLAFGIIVVTVIKELGIKEPEAIAKCTIKAGLLSGALMALIYMLVTVMGARSRGILSPADNGGSALAQISDYYYGSFGTIILAAIVTFACLKTSIGLITSCSETFCGVFPHVLSYKKWTVLFCTVSFLIANLGLQSILTFSLPVLMFLYPLAIVLIALNIFGNHFKNNRTIYRFTVFFTLIAALLDFLNALPVFMKEALHLSWLIQLAKEHLPLYAQGLGWICPALLGFLVGFFIYRLKTRKV